MQDIAKVTKYDFPKKPQYAFRMEDMSKIDPLVFQPFGVGPRNCIGMRFALMEIKMAICKLLLTFQLDPAEDTPVRHQLLFHFLNTALRLYSIKAFFENDVGYAYQKLTINIFCTTGMNCPQKEIFEF